MSRDKLVALFWPEMDSERGRHNLTQALYVARRALHRDDLFDVSADIRLKEEVISSDVAEFEAALALDPEAAVRLYRGPVLDGFFLSGASAFEQWCTAERARIEGEMLGALERVAIAARDAGDLRRAAEWWRKAAALRPLDSGIAVHLMDALAAAGDRAGALQYATVHITLLRDELDLEPDSAVRAMVSTLREQAASQPSSSVQRPASAGPVVERVEREPDFPRPPVDAIPAMSPVRVWPERPRPRRWRAFAILVIAVGSLVGIGTMIGYSSRSAPELAPLPVRQRVVVAPFRTAGAAPSLAYLRDGMVELLSTRLADDSAVRSVDAGAVIGAWHTAGLALAMDVPRDTVVRLAARLGAERVVVGGIVGSAAHVVIRATAMGVPGGRVMGQATVEGPADSLTALVDRLAGRLLLAEAGETERPFAHLTSSLPALRAWLAGQAAFRGDNYPAAIRWYERALTRDSTFALAALRLAQAADRLDDAETVRRFVAAAWTYRNRLSERDQIALVALAGPAYPDVSRARDLVDAWQREADQSPASAEASYEFAARLYHDGASAGVSDWMPRARAALERALSADSGYAPAKRLLSTLAHSRNDSAPAPPMFRERLRGARLQPDAHAPWRLSVLDALYAGGDTGAARIAATKLASVAPLLDEPPGRLDDLQTADLCVLGQWRLAQRDVAFVARIVSALRAAPGTGATAVVSAAPSACALLLEASAAVAQRRPNARAIVSHLDSLAFTTESAGDAALYAPLWLSRLHERLGDRPRRTP